MRPELMTCRAESVLVPYKFFSYSPDSMNFPAARSVSKAARLTKLYSRPFRSCILEFLVVSEPWRTDQFDLLQNTLYFVFTLFIVQLFKLLIECFDIRSLRILCNRSWRKVILNPKIHNVPHLKSWIVEEYLILSCFDKVWTYVEQRQQTFPVRWTEASDAARRGRCLWGQSDRWGVYDWPAGDKATSPHRSGCRRSLRRQFGGINESTLTHITKSFLALGLLLCN